MKIRYGTSWLAGGDLESPSGLSLNGTQVNDELLFYRAAAVTLQPRGNRATSLAFSVTKKFDTVRQAERFMHGHLGDLVPQEALYFFIGSDADGEWLRYDGAVIDNVAPQQMGTSLTLNYSFRAGLPTFDSPAPTVVEPASNMIARSTTAITNGAATVAVTFGTPFATTPVVVANVQIPNGGDFIWATLRDGSVTPSGFTADLSAPVPATGYKLTWIASA